MLGDGSIRYPNLRRDGKAQGNARYEMSMSAKAYGYMQSLFESTFAQFSGPLGLRPYPNLSLPQNRGKEVTQYYFSTRMLPQHYTLSGNSFVKIIPHFIGEIAASLAHWIMEDGYFDSYGRSQTIILCCFTEAECKLLQQVLLDMGIKSTLKIRDSSRNTYRIRISKRSMPLVRELVISYMHPDLSLAYKMGPP